MSDPQVEAMLLELNKQVDALHKCATDLSNTVEPFNIGFEQKSLMDNVKLYAIVSYLADVAKELSRVANVVDPVIAERITKRMTQEDMESIKYDGFEYKPTTKQYVSVNSETKPIVIQWLKQHERGREIVKEDVNSKTLESFVKSELADGKTVHPSINVFDKASLSVRKVRG